MSPLSKPSKVDGLKRGLGTAAALDTPDPAPRVRSDESIGRPEDIGTLVDQPKAEKWPARISMTASREMKRELEAARLEDGTEVTARLRAMITLWQSDPELRARVDELARTLR